MNLYKSKTYIEDLEYTIKNTPVLEKLNSSSVFITGATGLICSAVADLLFRYNEIYDAGITVLVAARSQERAEQRFSRYESSPYFRFIQYDATGKNDLKNRLPEHIDYIIHGASNSAPKDIQSHAVDTMLDNFTALYELLSYAEETGVQSTLFISSSEVYGNKETAEPYREDQYGYVDILNPRSSYSSGKRAGETL